MLELVKIDYNKETKEESFKPFMIYRKDIISLYRDNRGVFVVNTQGFMYKVPYKLDVIREFIGV